MWRKARNQARPKESICGQRSLRPAFRPCTVSALPITFVPPHDADACAATRARLAVRMEEEQVKLMQQLETFSTNITSSLEVGKKALDSCVALPPLNTAPEMARGVPQGARALCKRG